MQNIWDYILNITAGTAFIILIIYFLIRLTPSPPVGEMEAARKTLSVAGKEKADIYSKKLYREAKVWYDSAMINWRSENKKFIFSRNYDKVVKYAEKSIKKASEASDSSKSNTINLKTKAKLKIETLIDIDNDIKSLFTHYPLPAETRNRISKGEFLLREAEIAYNKGEYMLADRKITDSEYLLTSSYETAYSNLRSYFRSYPEWKRWIEKTIAESRDSTGYSIIVDKFSHKVFVYLNGTRKYVYSAELGKNWPGDKRIKGDKVTPEGMYKITKKFKSDSTKYYKALLLNYPNDEDTAKFMSDIARGRLPKSARIGDMIEIHGNGGKGADWTEGCIALTDREMDSIFRIVKVGTPVTIVGSMYDFKHIINQYLF